MLNSWSMSIPIIASIAACSSDLACELEGPALSLALALGSGFVFALAVFVGD
jgi:hypothetical protein